MIRSHGWRWTVAAVAVLGTLATGCTRSDRASGGGEKIGFCDAYKVYDGIPEPSPGDPSQVTTYAQRVVRVIDRIDAQFHVDGRSLPDVMVADLDAIEVRMRSFSAQYRSAAGDEAKRHAAEVDLASDQRFDTASRHIADYFQQHCRPKSRVPGSVRGSLGAGRFSTEVRA